MSNVWSFFSGAMGLDLGLEAVGLKPSLSVEVDPVFCQTIRTNRPEVELLEADVRGLNGATLRRDCGKDEVDLMVGGPPCQSFSPGGKRAALNDPRGNLIFEYLRLVGEIQPKRFVLENVANLLTAAVRHRPIAQRPGKSWNLASYKRSTPKLFDLQGGPPPLEADEQSGSALSLLLRTTVAELGYSVSLGILDASTYGAPQRRLRFVMVGDRDGTPPPLPEPTHGVDRAPIRTLRDVIGDLVDEPGPGSQYTESVRAVFDLVPEGGNWRSLPDEIAIKAMGEKSLSAGGGKTGFFRRLSWDQPAPTITGRANRKGSALCHPTVTRPLSVHECRRVQGFPDTWDLAGSMNQQYLQVGNAVPVELGKAIGLMAMATGTVDPPASDEMVSIALKLLRASARNTKSRRALAA